MSAVSYILTSAFRCQPPEIPGHPVPSVPDRTVVTS